MPQVRISAIQGPPAHTAAVGTNDAPRPKLGPRRRRQARGLREARAKHGQRGIDEMSVAELNELEEVKGLVTRGQRVGLLTYAEIVTATADVGLDETDADTLHGLLERRGIELVDELDPAAAVTPKIERATERHGRRNARQDLTP